MYMWFSLNTVVHRILVIPGWFTECFNFHSCEDRKENRNFVSSLLATTMLLSGSYRRIAGTDLLSVSWKSVFSFSSIGCC